MPLGLTTIPGPRNAELSLSGRAPLIGRRAHFRQRDALEPRARERLHADRRAARQHDRLEHGGGAAHAKELRAERQRSDGASHHQRVQQALAGELDIQGVYDAVGERLREVFDAAALVIARFDAAAGSCILRTATSMASASGSRQCPSRISRKVRRYYRVLAAHEPVRWNTQNEYRDWELFVAEGTDMSLSGVLAPIFAGDRLIGNDLDREPMRANMRMASRREAC